MTPPTQNAAQRTGPTAKRSWMIDLSPRFHLHCCPSFQPAPRLLVWPQATRMPSSPSSGSMNNATLTAATEYNCTHCKQLRKHQCATIWPSCIARVAAQNGPAQVELPPSAGQAHGYNQRWLWSNRVGESGIRGAHAMLTGPLGNYTCWRRVCCMISVQTEANLVPHHPQASKQCIDTCVLCTAMD